MLPFNRPRWQPLIHRLTALLLGASLVFSYAPFYQAWLTIPVMLLLLALTRRSSPRQAAQMGYFFGFGWFSAGLSWIYVSIDSFGGLHPVLSVAVLVVLFLYLSLFPALALWLWRRGSRWFADAAIWLLPLIWLGTESLRGWLLTGFPWLELGYSQTDSALGNYAPWLGGTGITLVMLIISIALLRWLQTRKAYFLALAGAPLALAFVLPLVSPLERTGETARILLVQGNISQSVKWNPDQHWPTLMRYLNLSRPYYDQHDIIVWPESAVTMPEPFTDDVLANIHANAAATETALITGIIDYQGGDYYNSLIVLGQDGADQVNQDYYHGHDNRYRKHHLLPIGEFVPFEDLVRPLAPLFDLPMSSFARGEFRQPNLQARGFRLSAAICYEILFPDQVRASLAPDTDFLLTVSNDTWFGRSHGPAQHMQIARMRALELGRPLIRATNSGVSALVDEHGQQLQTAPQFVAATLSASLPVVTGDTGFARWGAALNWLLAIFLAFIPIFSMVKRRQNK